MLFIVSAFTPHLRRRSQLGTGAVQDDGIKTETVQKRKGEREVIELVGEDGTADPEQVSMNRLAPAGARAVRT